MSSRRIYITLNDQKEKDRIISDYLSQSYSEADAIKEAMYRLAINNIQQAQTSINSTEKMQLAPKHDRKVKKDTKRQSSKKGQKGANKTDKVEKITDDNNLIQSVPKSDIKILKDTNSEDKAQIGFNDDISLDLGQFTDEPVEVKQEDNESKVQKLKEKKLKALKQFM